MLYTTNEQLQVEGQAAPVQATKAYEGSESTAPRILNFIIR
jgi:hypothetical protein